MKFGSVPIADAAGAILAHSVRLPEGRLRKGILLEPRHLSALAEAGHERVTVARLDEGDLHENDAATALAEALSARHGEIHLGEAFTGRVNLSAKSAGVVQLDVEAIHAANLIDPAITIATVAPYQQLHPGGMIATIKIIPYGVEKSAVIRACDAMQGAVSLARPVYQTASLIVSDISGGPGKKGVGAIANRLSGLGIDLVETLTCRHETAAMSNHMSQAAGEVILVLTGSATSDSKDTAPSALLDAGGTLERFGMPVDPGNLLFLGVLGEKPVIGLPGSARSPVLHGADWVLSRVVCGIHVTSEDIARMGVGGLLKEIPTRPQPRRSLRQP